MKKILIPALSIAVALSVLTTGCKKDKPPANEPPKTADTGGAPPAVYQPIEQQQPAPVNNTYTPPPQPAGNAGGSTVEPAPAVKHTNTATHTGKTYKVKKGDTLTKIAKAKYPSMKSDKAIKKIVAANPGLDPNKIHVGQVLNMP